ncbi:NAD(P)H:quinone oxidoreductase, type IV [Mucor velutinosus]|uniref:NAD(P)H:quinone oxidoreductase, type IV n=1 Tax=Mucor velutinosus TaxID=708070 RepID=A0AAN7DLD1_9FUNG|nr:NAD(P)H:quinone oxidoreductase, type IV [Mucor velutinosus]
MLSRRQLPLAWITLLILMCIVSTVFAKKHHHDDDDDDDDDDYDDDDDDKKVVTEEPEFTTPSDEKWLEDLDLDDIEGRVRPVGSGVCENAKCDGSDNDRCFESCGNMATEDDIYGCPSEKTWALTFDDGPSNFTTDLLDILDKANVKATFCVMGAHAKQYPEIIKRAYDAGHQIASHTYSHPHLMSLSNEKIVYEVRATEEAIEAAIGVKPRYIRPPYGEADARVKSILKKMGYKTLMWNVDPTDYNVHMLKDGAERIQRAFEDIASGKPSPLNAHNDSGFISLQHDLYPTSIGQVSKIIEALRSKGFKLSTAAECVGDRRPHASDDDDDDDDEEEEKKKHDEEEEKKKHDEEEQRKHDEEEKEKNHDHDDDDEDDDDEYSEDALKIKEDSFAASGLQSGSDSEKNQQQEAISAANSVTFSAAASSILAACGILINYLI